MARCQQPLAAGTKAHAGLIQYFAQVMTHSTAVDQPAQRAPGGALRARLPDGRLHFQHGPIDLIMGVEGAVSVVQAATEAAWQRFDTILPELVAELSALRRPIPQAAPVAPALSGAVARRMAQACWPHRRQYMTCMAAVAGAVADEVLEALLSAGPLDRAYVNNGGDIAIHLSAGQSYAVGLLANVDHLHVRAGQLLADGRFTLLPHMGIGGVATSGWRGRSQSLGIADSVTVFATCAAQADAAATLVANAVNVQHPAIRRAPADTVKDDTDLGSLLVTLDVGALPDTAVNQALDSGEREAQGLLAAGHIKGAVLVLQGQARMVGLEHLGASG